MSTSDLIQTLTNLHHVLQLQISQDKSISMAELHPAIERLYRLVERPEDTAARMIQQHLEAACLRQIMENGMLAKMCSAKRLDWTASKLADISGGREDRTDAIMKVLASAGIVKSVRKCTYAANEVSEILNHLEHRQAIQRPRFEHYEAGVRARDGQSNHVAKENIEIPWFKIFPLESELKKTDGGLKYDRTLIVEIDGESTRRLRAFRRAFPDIRGRCILEVSPRKLRDLWDRFESGKEARPEGDIRLLGYNTLAAPQPVQGARVYLLHGNLHNRYHDDILQILRNTAVAMDVNYSRLIIVERVIAFSKAGNDFRKGQSPGGTGRSGSTDRTEQQWRDVLNQAGMQVVQIRGKEGTNRNVIEAMVSSHEWI